MMSIDDYLERIHEGNFFSYSYVTMYADFQQTIITASNKKVSNFEYYDITEKRNTSPTFMYVGCPFPSHTNDY